MKTSINIGLAVAILAGAGAVAYGVLKPEISDSVSVRLAPEDTSLVAMGKKIYEENCASCHGVRLEGEPDWQQRRPDGLLPAPPHDVSGHTWHHPDEVLFSLTKYGPAQIVGQGYQSAMPGYQDILDDRQIIAVLSYIKSRWPREIRARHDQMNEAAQNRN
ncbi:cytochrome c [Thalassospira sp.]|uniref:c-type cytochrome n=1 Tax=Thalassospira sp. TaxID=1912094 RepID=UPI002734B1F4|nr:cytochrome c [Thalassospira sp.]MDP2697739.1 cytochrome c [Thalassospira sp.]